MGCEASEPAPTAAEIAARFKRAKEKELALAAEAKKRDEEREMMSAALSPLTAPQVAPSAICHLDGFEWTQAIDREMKVLVDLYAYHSAQYNVTSVREYPDMSTATKDRAYMAYSFLSTRENERVKFEHPRPPFLEHRATVPIGLVYDMKFVLFCRNYCLDFNREVLKRLNEKKIPYRARYWQPHGYIIALELDPVVI